MSIDGGPDMTGQWMSALNVHLSYHKRDNCTCKWQIDRLRLTRHAPSSHHFFIWPARVVLHVLHVVFVVASL